MALTMHCKAAWFEAEWRQVTAGLLKKALSAGQVFDEVVFG
jgi:hypothetical protein